MDVSITCLYSKSFGTTILQPLYLLRVYTLLFMYRYFKEESIAIVTTLQTVQLLLAVRKSPEDTQSHKAD